MTELATYVYCVVRGPGPGAAPEVVGAPAGLPGAGPARVLSLGGALGGPLGADLWLVVADVPLADYDAEEIERRLADMDWVSERAMAHEKVVEHFAAAGPVVPMKLFTLFAGDERAVAGLGGRREALAGILARIDGSAEWGLRVVFQESRARDARRLGRGGDGGESGTGFLLRKKRQQEAQRELVREALASAENAFEALSGHAREARRRTAVESPGVQLLLDAVFLVAGDRADEFERAVRTAAVELGDLACEVTLTGPWPPYNFVEEAR